MMLWRASERDVCIRFGLLDPPDEHERGREALPLLVGEFRKDEGAREIPSGC